MAVPLDQLQALRQVASARGSLSVEPWRTLDALRRYIAATREPVPQLIPPGTPLLARQEFEETARHQRAMEDIQREQIAAQERIARLRASGGGGGGADLLTWLLGGGVALPPPTAGEELAWEPGTPLTEVIRSAKEVGMTDAMVRQALKQRGYSDEDIDYAFRVLGEGAQQPAVQEAPTLPPVRSSDEPLWPRIRQLLADIRQRYSEFQQRMGKFGAPGWTE